MENQAIKKRSAGRVTIDVIVWIIVIFATLFTIYVFSTQANGGVPNFFGKIPVSIQTNSMTPTFSAGDLIFDNKVANIKDLKKDDVITFWTIIEGKRVMNTHRIVSVNQDGSFTTKGDANGKNDDSNVYAADVVGMYTKTKMAGVGSVMSFLQSSTGFLFCIVLPLLLFFLYEVYNFIVVVVATKKPKISSEEEDEIKKKAVEEYIKSQEQEKQDETL